MSRLLTDQERLRFVGYCRETADAADKLAKQLSNIFNHDEFAKRLRNTALAYAIVAKDLESVESCVIEQPGEPAESSKL